MRVEAEPNATAYLTSRAAANTLVSDESEKTLDITDTHVSYHRGPSFVDSPRRSPQTPADGTRSN